MIHQIENYKTLPSQISHYEDAHAHAIANLFERAFGIPLSEQLWSWKMHLLHGSGSVLWHEQSAIAFYGGIPRKLYYQGFAVNGLQIRDVMVDPEWRGLLRKQGAFWQVATHYLHQKIGQDKEYAVGFGFPNDKASKLGQKLNLYETSDQIQELTWYELVPLTWHQRIFYSIEFEKQPSHKLIDDLWLNMRYSLTQFVVGIRDANYIKLRFIDHPVNNYQFLIVRKKMNHPIGLIIIRLNNDEKTAEIIDIITSVTNINITIELAINKLIKNNYKQVKAWLSSSISERILLMPQSKKHIAQIEIGPPHRMLVPKASWWATAGDTDFR